MFDILKIPPFRLYLIGSFISFIGTYMQIVAIGWHVYSLTHSAFYLGILGLVGFVPALIAFLPVGVMVDVHHKKDILLLTECLLGVVAFLLFITTQTHIITIWLLFTLLFISSLISSAEGATRHATIPLLIPPHHLSQALSLQTVARQIGAIIGPALAGFAIAFYGVQSVYLLNALSFFFFFAMILFLTVPKVVAKGDITTDVVFEGIRFIKNNSLIATTMLLDFFATFFAGAMVLLPVFAKDVYHASAQQLGLLYAAPSVGAVVAGVYFSSKKKLHHQGKVLLAAVGIYGLGTIGFGLSSVFILGFFFLAVLGAGDMVSTIIRNVIRQTLTPPTLRGRVLSVVALFFMGGPFLGDAEAGFVAGFFGAPISVVVGGVATILVTLGIAWKSPKLRNYEEDDLQKTT